MSETNASVPAGGDPLAGWRVLIAERLGAPPLRFEVAIELLEAESLRVHGVLLRHIAMQDADSETAAYLMETFGPEELGELILAAEDEARSRGVELPLSVIVRRYSLSPVERALLTLTVARAVAPGTGPLLAALQGGKGHDRLTVALAVALLGGDAVFTPAPASLFGPQSRLIQNGLLKLSRPSAGASSALIDRIIEPSDALVATLCGEPDIAEPLVGYAELVWEPAPIYTFAAEEAVNLRLEAIARSLVRYRELVDAQLDSETPPFEVQALTGVLGLISGPHGSGKSLAAEVVASSAERPLLRLRAHRIAAASNPSALIDEAYAQAGLFDAVVCVLDAEALLSTAGAVSDAIVAGVRRHRGLTLLTSSEPARLASSISAHLIYHVRLDLPAPPERVQIWETLLPQHITLDGEPRLVELANRFELTGGQIRNAVVSGVFEAIRRDPDEPALRTADLEAGARTQLATRLDEAKTRGRSRFGLDAIVLPEETDRAVRELLDACRHRTEVLNEWGFGRRLSSGKGIVALFGGEPGTGKTYCTELLANELDLALQVVSVPEVMSKWVGETEKNISRLFSHARAQNTLLMFDEADALFTTRVKVERAADRFSNMEVNHLLQEIDRFEGVVILTTNLETSMDRAMKRRVGFHITFPMPDVDAREQIWRTLTPPEAPLAPDVSFAALAEQFELPGGHIKNILVRAAYRACARGQVIDTEILQEVAEEECRVAGKLFRRMEDLPTGA